jgi:hypothetical protein
MSIKMGLGMAFEELQVRVMEWVWLGWTCVSIIARCRSGGVLI